MPRELLSMVAAIKVGNAQSGFTYVFFLWFILVFGIMLGTYIEVTSTQSKRLKEQDFVNLGLTYTKALENYYKDHLVFPSDINFLLCDGRNYPCKRYLRALYSDPLTNKAFVYIIDEQQQIIGVRTNAQGDIINAKLREDYKVEHYQDLKFEAKQDNRTLQN